MLTTIMQLLLYVIEYSMVTQNCLLISSIILNTLQPLQNSITDIQLMN